MKRYRAGSYGLAFVLALLIVVLWELSIRFGLMGSTQLPSPVAILQALVENADILFVHALQTLLETIFGLIIATLIGLLFALLLILSERARLALYPWLIISQTIPLIAIAPLLLLWFGFDLGPKVAIVALYCFFPISIACFDGMQGTDPTLLRLMQAMNASRWQILWFLQLPGAMPAFFSGLRLAATYGVTAAIFAEFAGAIRGLEFFCSPLLTHVQLFWS